MLLNRTMSLIFNHQLRCKYQWQLFIRYVIVFVYATAQEENSGSHTFEEISKR